ncbi:hypothetical protein DB346_11340 [Verrucomicrobia bacterium LW23]|nr:hypothetical protein DB346_11340 [Verrucomicrobia bacterium LW23]
MYPGTSVVPAAQFFATARAPVRRDLLSPRIRLLWGDMSQPSSASAAAVGSASGTSAAWQDLFHTLFTLGLERFSGGTRGASALFSAAEVAQLEAMGFRAQEIYDFVEDNANYGEPVWATVLAVQTVRHEYFTKVQDGVLPAGRYALADFPAKSAAVDGISWLPRLIMKARAKLRGQLPDELMYGCAGDRHFFAEHRLELPTFLREVWRAGEDTAAIVEYVKNPSSR